MTGRVLAFLESTIGTRLLVVTTLAELDYRVEVVSTAHRFRSRLAAEPFDWLVLDEAAAGSTGRSFLRDVATRARGARVAWIGSPRAAAGLSVEVVVHKPLRHDDIARVFASASHENLRSHSAANGRSGLAGS